MKRKHIPHRSARLASLRRSAPVLVLGVLAVVSSFTAGIQTSGDVRPIDAMEAHEPTPVAGDMNGDTVVDAHDVVVALDIALGTIKATPMQLKADPTPDGRLTVEDARQIAAIASR